MGDLVVLRLRHVWVGLQAPAAPFQNHEFVVAEMLEADCMYQASLLHALRARERMWYGRDGRHRHRPDSTEILMHGYGP